MTQAQHDIDKKTEETAPEKKPLPLAQGVEQEDEHLAQAAPQAIASPDVTPAMQAVALDQATNGDHTQSGETLLQLQSQYGNRYVQRVVEQAQNAPVQEKEDAPQDSAPAENKTGLPDQLKAGVEALSGLSMDDVRVHYNSPKPAELQALAYAQGTDIHVAPGQEEHLSHEAWHVVQQKQGRVQSTTSIDGRKINDDAGLEKEADILGAKALSSIAQRNAKRYSPYANWTQTHSHSYSIGPDGVIQGVFDKETLTRDIVEYGSRIHSAGGTTHEAYIITTDGEHKKIFVKFTTSAFSVEAARLAAEFGVRSPRAIELDKAAIQKTVNRLNPEIGSILAKKTNVIAFEYVGGLPATERSAVKFDDDSYRQIGEIAAFDMLIGKTDLFENYEQFNPEQENYNNVLINNSNLIDIDFSPGQTGDIKVSYRHGLRSEIVRRIIDNPEKIDPFVEKNIGGLFALGSSRLNYLLIQRGGLGNGSKCDWR